ncbi:MAG TPA: iron-containing alcohol dehydrogenase [Thermoplasmata archaeon]|jgi:alcohol dehydrogenase YqhD (iron-dependent ADH family)|nr:iron-containing alcohol dehydrogenase [Thermoplasmata archaeon]HIH28548.1 iron-containing alcohol dehydrogenase [Thermoplasmata archaeon]
MLNFNYNVSTRIFFGRNSIEHLGDELKQYGTRVLFVSGQGSIKKTGLYDTVIDIFSQNGLVYHELSGVQPNPRISLVRQGVRLCRDHDIQCIVAVGGGSVIDSAKTIATGYYHDGDPWDLFVLGDASVKKALPIGTVLTFSGTGSEMNGNAVISNEETTEKLAIHKDVLRPRFSILDPTYTFSMSENQTAAGTVDIFSHILEQYFSPTRDAFLQNRLAEGLLKTCIQYGPVALEAPRDYEARAQLMWTSSIALNGLLGYGRVSDWATHGVEHALSAMFDVTHGVGLAILTPYWMELVLSDETMSKFVEYARNVWMITGNNDRTVAKEGIEKTREFFTALGMPQKLRDVGVTQNALVVMVEKAVVHGDLGKFKKLGKPEILSLLNNAF